MARVTDQPLYRGTIGNLIFYTRGGKQYVRSKPAKVRQPNTPKQLLARDKFRQSSKLAKALSRACLGLGQYNSKSNTSSSYHTLLGVLRTGAFVEDQKPVRWLWEDLSIRQGNKPQLDLGGQFYPESQKLHLSWNSRAISVGSVLLLVGINTENLEVEIYRFPMEKGEGIIGASSKTAWYACVEKPGIHTNISGSQFVTLVE